LFFANWRYFQDKVQTFFAQQPEENPAGQARRVRQIDTKTGLL